MISEFINKRKNNKTKCEVLCPNCDNIQTEPKGSVSTCCKKCGIYINTRNHLFESRTQNDKEVVLKQKKIIEYQYEEENEEEMMEISCLSCLNKQEVSVDDLSSVCEKCDSYINLRNYNIYNHVNLDVQTRGNIYVKKLGTLAGEKIVCNDLILEGQLSGNIYCLGDVILKEGSVLIGKILCNNLVIEKDVNICTHSRIIVNNLDFMGNSKGEFIVKNKATIHKNSKLKGSLQAKSMEVMPNANFIGNFKTFH